MANRNTLVGFAGQFLQSFTVAQQNKQKNELLKALTETKIKIAKQQAERAVQQQESLQGLVQTIIGSPGLSGVSEAPQQGQGIPASGPEVLGESDLFQTQAATPGVPGQNILDLLASPEGQQQFLQLSPAAQQGISGLAKINDPLKAFQRQAFAGTSGGGDSSLADAGMTPQSKLRFGLTGKPELLFEEKNIREVNIPGFGNALVDLGKFKGGTFDILARGPQKELPAAQVKAMTDALAVANNLGTIKQIAKNNPEFFGPLNALWETIKLKIPGMGNPQASKVYAKIQSTFNIVAKLRSGAVLNKEELKRLGGELPSKFDTAENFEGKMDNFLETLIDIMSTKVEGFKRAGIDVRELEALFGKEVTQSLMTITTPPGQLRLSPVEVKRRDELRSKQ